MRNQCIAVNGSICYRGTRGSRHIDDDGAQHWGQMVKLLRRVMNGWRDTSAFATRLAPCQHFDCLIIAWELSPPRPGHDMQKLAQHHERHPLHRSDTAA